MRYTYSCARCGGVHVSEAPLPTMGPLFICDGCKLDYGPKAPVDLQGWFEFLSNNPTDAGHHD